MSSPLAELHPYSSRTIAFYDLDPLGVVWHGNYLKYIDEARMALFDSAGLDLYGTVRSRPRYAFPIVRSSVKHVAPLLLRDRITVFARVTDARFKICLEFEVRREDGVLSARARSEQVAVRLPELTMEYRIPSEVADALCPTRL